MPRESGPSALEQLLPNNNPKGNNTEVHNRKMANILRFAYNIV